MKINFLKVISAFIFIYRVTRIINDFRVIDNRTFSHEFMQDVKVVMQGILGLTAVEKVMALSGE